MNLEPARHCCVVVAPDKFAGTLSAGAAAEAIARGWRSVRPGDRVEVMPLADGGPGFVAARAVSDGVSVTTMVPGPFGEPVAAQWLVTEGSEGSEGSDGGRTAWIESAAAWGRHLTGRRDPMRASSAGVGTLIAAALEHGCRRIIVGLGGSAGNDGGAGMLATLGVTAAGPDGGVDLTRGGGGLGVVDRVDLDVARTACSPVTLVAATDVDVPLLGPTGASMGFSRQKGASAQQAAVLEHNLALWSHACRGDDLAVAPGSGAAGGLGFGMRLLGATQVSGVAVLLDELGASERWAGADLIITGEGRLDWQSLHGKVPSGVADLGRRLGVPVIALVGQNDLGDQQAQAAGFAQVRSLVRMAGSNDAAMRGAAELLSRASAALAGDWRPASALR